MLHEQHEHDDEVGLLDDEAREDDDEVVVSVVSDEVVRDDEEQEIRGSHSGSRNKKARERDILLRDTSMPSERFTRMFGQSAMKALGATPANRDQQLLLHVCEYIKNSDLLM